MHIQGAWKFQEVCVRSFISAGWSPDFGGMTSYIAKDEDEEVL